MLLMIGLWTFLRALLSGSAAIALENLALRHQLAVLQRSVRRPRLSRWDRILWVWLSRVWASWRSNLVIVQPPTVLAWHRRGFQRYWRWKSKAKPVGRPRLDPELRQLIRRMARENPTWGRRRTRAELTLLGYEVAELTVAKYMPRTTSAIRFCRSSPLRPGSRTSSTKQPGTSGRVLRRKSCADANASTRSPTDRMRFLSDSRVPTSSSTTKTMASAAVMPPVRSAT